MQCGPVAAVWGMSSECRDVLTASGQTQQVSFLNLIMRSEKSWISWTELKEFVYLLLGPASGTGVHFWVHLQGYNQPYSTWSYIMDLPGCDSASERGLSTVGWAELNVPIDLSKISHCYKITQLVQFLCTECSEHNKVLKSAKLDICENNWKLVLAELMGNLSWRHNLYIPKQQINIKQTLQTRLQLKTLNLSLLFKIPLLIGEANIC